MSIIVIDQGPELFWFVSKALIDGEIHLKHFQTIETGEQHIFKELPKIVILNGDDGSVHPEKFISKMRTHVFARDTLFIVFTSDMSEEFKKKLLIAGAAQILYRGKDFSPSLKFLSIIIKWCLDYKAPDPALFDYKPSKFNTDAVFTSYGRVGWITSTHCMIEANIDIKIGQSIDAVGLAFEEMGIKDVKLECVEKDKVGRYYQYSHSLLCKIHSKDPAHDTKKLEIWIQNNREISKHKPVKLVYFEDHHEYRSVIKQMIKVDKRYCARGYDSIDTLSEILNYQMPHLVLINRSLVSQDRVKFEKIKDFMKNNFCYCITYSTGEETEVETEDFKKKFDFAMHVPGTLDLALLESMIQKLEEKLPEAIKTEDHIIYFNKHSVFSRINFQSPATMNEIAINGAGMILPFGVSNFAACELSSPAFGVAQINHRQFFRIFSSQVRPTGTYHQMIFMGQNIHDNEHVNDAIGKIEEFGYEKWLVGDFSKP